MTRTLRGSFAIWGSMFAALVVSSCSSASTPYTPLGHAATKLPAGRIQSAQHVYAFSSLTTTSVAAFPIDANGSTNATWALHGPKTHLQQGHGMAFDAKGVLYVLAGSPGQPLRLLAFGKDKSGNAKPAAEYRFPSSSSSMLVDYTDGLGFDTTGNFWLSDAAGARLRAFKIKGGRLEQVAAFEPKLHTSMGWESAGPHAMYLDAANHLYCWMSFLYQGIGEVGATEYDVSDPLKPRAMRSFFDPNFPDVPPDTMAFDAKGYMYAANTNSGIGLRVYSPAWKPAMLPVRIVGNYTPRSPYFLGSIAALTVLPDGTLYVAQGTGSEKLPPGIMVYPPGAKGSPKPKQVITSTQYLQYGDGTGYGNLIVIK